MQPTVFLCWLFAAVSVAHACSCGSSWTPLKALANSGAVFTGEIIDIKPAPYDVPGIGMVDGFAATVKVAKCWKGKVTGIIEVHTGTGYGDCGIEFAEEAYLFYVGKGQDGKLYASACNRTAPLKTTGEETLELDGKLPTLTTPEHEPTMELEGKINDAGYSGYVFTLHNLLHKRMFYIDRQYIGQWIQVQHHGKWVDYAPNYFMPPPRFSAASAAKMFSEWRRGYAKVRDEQAAVFLDRLKDTDIFVGTVPPGLTWRVGFQYLSEQEFDAGKNIQGSVHHVWSNPISPANTTKELSFEEAFPNVNAIPKPLGTMGSSTPTPPSIPAEAKP